MRQVFVVHWVPEAQVPEGTRTPVGIFEEGGSCPMTMQDGTPAHGWRAALTGMAPRLKGEVQLAWSEVHWPASLDAEVCSSFLRQLATDRLMRLVVLEVEAKSGMVSYR